MTPYAVFTRLSSGRAQIFWVVSCSKVYGPGCFVTIVPLTLSESFADRVWNFCWALIFSRRESFCTAARRPEAFYLWGDADPRSSFSSTLTTEGASLPSPPRPPEGGGEERHFGSGSISSLQLLFTFLHLHGWDNIHYHLLVNVL